MSNATASGEQMSGEGIVVNAREMTGTGSQMMNLSQMTETDKRQVTFSELLLNKL